MVQSSLSLTVVNDRFQSTKKSAHRSKYGQRRAINLLLVDYCRYGKWGTGTQKRREGRRPHARTCH